MKLRAGGLLKNSIRPSLLDPWRWSPGPVFSPLRHEYPGYRKNSRFVSGMPSQPAEKLWFWVEQCFSAAI